MGIHNHWNKHYQRWSSSQPNAKGNKQRHSRNTVLTGSECDRNLQYSRRNKVLAIHPDIFWSRFGKRNSDTKKHTSRIGHRVGISLLSVGLYGLSLPAYAQDVGGVSATAAPIANSSGSVTNQAIQVLQGPYITNTYGGGVSCQGPTLNITPFITDSTSKQEPYEAYYNDPVYDMRDLDDDGAPDNPGSVLFYKPIRTGQKNSMSFNYGLSATISIPLDFSMQTKCKAAADAQTKMQNQLIANKRLDYEIARLKNCGELMKQGIMFHPKSPYYAICADVVLITPKIPVSQHTHTISVPASTPSRFSLGPTQLGSDPSERSFVPLHSHGAAASP